MRVRAFRIDSMDVRALSVPLVDPFVIASGRVDATRSALVRVRLEGGEEGMGEGAALPPVTREDQGDVIADVERARATVVRAWGRVEEVGEALAEIGAVARAAIETALLDALARRDGVAVRELLGGARGAATRAMTTDVTIPILDASRMAELAREWRARGFSCFKLKVGKDLDHDLRALEAVKRAAPDATFRIDANAGFDAESAIAMARATEKLGLVVECWEQPCGAHDLDAMAKVAASVAAPVVADESVATMDDLARVRAARAARGINLKLVKSGGPLAAYALGRAAQDAGMKLMTGGMVETRLGMTAAAHVVAALGGVDFVDLDTAWLLASDPFDGGYVADGPHYTLRDAPGLDLVERHPPR
jgi:L-alanine-DL-glutamate epimerase-like enolase superfamily enzyme